MKRLERKERVSIPHLLDAVIDRSNNSVIAEVFTIEKL